MKIAIVCYPTFGGSGVVATELGLELAKEVTEIHFITTYSQPIAFGFIESNVHYHESSRSRISVVSLSTCELAFE